MRVQRWKLSASFHEANENVGKAEASYFSLSRMYALLLDIIVALVLYPAQTSEFILAFLIKLRIISENQQDEMVFQPYSLISKVVAAKLQRFRLVVDKEVFNLVSNVI
ncbi:MAG: hypothetical protein EZS28_054750 [Streblomastix strix]|uniref:Uncharacterized protein n=1 Tax=Streblomastix strix TaxID=222440 RepID=A0A5J4QFY7_9EUKA|nr:MAG: hypothetical protein EZS28_054750 [Streblomastix strix]